MDKILTIKERILQFIDIQGIKKEDFYQKTDITASNFKGAGLKSEIGGNKLVKILTVFPEINPDWLLTGNGEMFRNSNQNLQPVATSQENEDVQMLKQHIKLLNEKIEQMGGDENKTTMQSMVEFMYDEMKKRSILEDLETLEKMAKEKNKQIKENKK